jgi:hypothetical protein
MPVMHEELRLKTRLAVKVQNKECGVQRGIYFFGRPFICIAYKWCVGGFQLVRDSLDSRLRDSVKLPVECVMIMH